METVDRNILNIIQVDFPINRHPYRLVGEEVGITEEEAWKRVTNLRRSGIIRRIGGVFNSSRLGYVSTLCTVEVPRQKISVLADYMYGIDEITHSYLRDHPRYNMWFTIIASSQQRIEKIISDIQALIGSTKVYSLPALKVFKIGVIFKLGPDDFRDQLIKTQLTDHLNAAHDSRAPVTEYAKTLIRLLQKDFPYSLNPYSDLAYELGTETGNLLTAVKELMDLGVMRRLGAILVHRKSGFISNVMGVWAVPAGQVHEAGTKMAKFAAVTHCYHRQGFHDWPYNLFTMIHGHSDQECLKIMSEISKETGINNYEALFSIKELKKTSMFYFNE